MPQYFFDIDRNGVMERDETGLEFDSVEDARVCVFSSMPEMLPAVEHYRLAIAVREGSTELFTATIALSTDSPAVSPVPQEQRNGAAQAQPAD